MKQTTVGLLIGAVLASVVWLCYIQSTKPYDGPERIWETNVVALSQLESQADDRDRSDLDFSAFNRVADIKYGDHDRQVFDLYLPEVGNGPHPIVVFVHGSGLSRSNKGDSPNDWTVPLLGKGIAVAQIEYRPIKSTKIEFKHPAQIDDCKSAILAVARESTKHGIDGSRIGLMGESFGGHIAATVGTVSSSETFDFKLKGVCVINGMTDFTTYKDEAAHHRQSLGIASPALDATILGYVEPMREDDPDGPRKASAVPHVHANAPPFFLIYGFADPVVPPQQGNRLFTELRNVGGDVVLSIIPGAGHGGPALCNPTTREAVAQFFKRTLN